MAQSKNHSKELAKISDALTVLKKRIKKIVDEKENWIEANPGTRDTDIEQEKVDALCTTQVAITDAIGSIDEC